MIKARETAALRRACALRLTLADGGRAIRAALLLRAGLATLQAGHAAGVPGFV